MLLQTEHVSRHFGALQAVRDVSLQVTEGECRSIIGPNGAGKTTLFNVIGGAIPPSSGTVWLRGKRIDGLPLHRMARLGIGRSYQLTSLFPALTVFENVRLAIQALSNDGFKFWRKATTIPTYDERTQAVLRLVGLHDQRNLLATQLSHGEKRKLELALALAGEPTVLLLDEPTAGMAANQVPELVELLGALRQRSNQTLLLVEHRMDVVMHVSDVITVMHQGAVLTEGPPAAIASDPQVQKAYLGDLYNDMLEVNDAPHP